jgi:hypothetical protein
MKTKNIALILTIGLGLSLSLNGQISLGKLKNQASNAVGNAVDRKIEQEMNKAADRVVQKYWDRVIGKYYAGLYSDDTAAGSGIQFILTEDVDLLEAYSFSNSAKIKIDNYKKNGKLSETAYMNLYTQPNANYMGMLTEDEESKKRGDEIFVVNDFANQAFVILMNSKDGKSRIAYKLVARQSAQPTSEAEVTIATETAPPTFTELGTKTIMGYTCKGYSFSNTESENEVWVTTEDVLGMQSLFGMQGVRAEITAQEGYPTGSIMELTSVDKESGEKTVMQVVDVAKNANVNYSIADYPAINMGTADKVE